jgi:hypothetical protein
MKGFEALEELGRESSDAGSKSLTKEEALGPLV